MRADLRSLPLALLFAFGAAATAHAQTKPFSRERVELPVWNRSSGEIEAVLVLEPADLVKSSGNRARFGMHHLDTTFGLAVGDSLGMLCDRKQGLNRALDNLVDNCVLAALPDPARRNGAAAMFGRNGTKVGIGAANTRGSLPLWMAPGAGNGKVDINEVTVFSQKDLPRQGYVSIAGTVAKARLQNPADIPGFNDRWTSRQLNLSGGVGSFGVNIIGEVVDTPGSNNKWEGLSLGLSWRTPWSGQLTVGADNLVTRGKNPFTPSSAQADEEGAVPYVRYEQDL